MPVFYKSIFMLYPPQVLVLNKNEIVVCTYFIFPFELFPWTEHPKESKKELDRVKYQGYNWVPL